MFSPRCWIWALVRLCVYVAGVVSECSSPQAHRERVDQGNKTADVISRSTELNSSTVGPRYSLASNATNTAQANSCWSKSDAYSTVSSLCATTTEPLTSSTTTRSSSASHTPLQDQILTLSNGLQAPSLASTTIFSPAASSQAPMSPSRSPIVNYITSTTTSTQAAIANITLSTTQSHSAPTITTSQPSSTNSAGTLAPSLIAALTANAHSAIRLTIANQPLTAYDDGVVLTPQTTLILEAGQEMLYFGHTLLPASDGIVVDSQIVTFRPIVQLDEMSSSPPLSWPSTSSSSSSPSLSLNTHLPSITFRRTGTTTAESASPTAASRATLHESVGSQTPSSGANTVSISSAWSWGLKMWIAAGAYWIANG